MSYILEALRKAERERNLGQIPDLKTDHGPSAPSRKQRWPWLLALALLANAWVLLTLLLDNDNPVEHINATVPATAQRPTTMAASTTPDPASVSQLVPLPPASPTEQPLPEQAPPEQTAASVPVSQSLPISRFSAPTNKSLATAESILETPALQTLPSNFRQSLATLNLDVHVYSNSPEKRFVMINSKHYREGEQLYEGPLLETITPQGVVLHHQGRRFLLPVQR